MAWKPRPVHKFSVGVAVWRFKDPTLHGGPASRPERILAQACVMGEKDLARRPQKRCGFPTTGVSAKEATGRALESLAVKLRGK